MDSLFHPSNRKYAREALTNLQLYCFYSTMITFKRRMLCVDVAIEQLNDPTKAAELTDDQQYDLERVVSIMNKPLISNITTLISDKNGGLSVSSEGDNMSMTDSIPSEVFVESSDDGMLITNSIQDTDSSSFTSPSLHIPDSYMLTIPSLSPPITPCTSSYALLSSLESFSHPNTSLFEISEDTKTREAFLIEEEDEEEKEKEEKDYASSSQLHTQAWLRTVKSASSLLASNNNVTPSSPLGSLPTSPSSSSSKRKRGAFEIFDEELKDEESKPEKRKHGEGITSTPPRDKVRNLKENKNKSLLKHAAAGGAGHNIGKQKNKKSNKIINF